VTTDQASDESPDQASDQAFDQAPESEPVMRSTMVGAEMLNWSDLEPTDGRPATGGPVAAALLDAALTESDSVLVAGPHSLELIEQVAGRVAAVDVLVRSAPDAEEIAAALVDRPVRVFCGALDRFDSGHGEKSYDVVIALDGLPRLVGPDTPVLTWTDALAALRDRLGPTGRLLLAAANPFGIERLLQPDVTATLPRDEAWPRDVTGSVEAPAGLRAIRAAVESTGLSLSRVYAIYPDLMEARIGLTDATGPLAGALVARAVAGRFTGPALMDPYRTAQDAVAAGLGNELAAGWFLVVGTTSLPEVLAADALPEEPGELLEETLLAALRVDDHLALRRAISGYADWLRSQDVATAAIAAPDNLLSDGTSYRVFDEAAPATLGGGDALLLNQLARFVRRSLNAGVRQPWVVGATARSVTARLASMAGITVDDRLWQTVSGGDDLVQPNAYAEQSATIARLSQELMEAQAQVDWTEYTLHRLRRSHAYRLGRAMLNPARAVYNRVHHRIR
jgi:hypothetical protein